VAINFAAQNGQQLQSERFSEKRKYGFVVAQEEAMPPEHTVFVRLFVITEI